MVDLKITVLKTLSTQDVFGEATAEEMGAKPNNICPVIKEGSVYTVEKGKIPEGFCTWMWHDIYPEAVTLQMGGNFPWMKEEGTIIASCSDGMRPVIVKMERINEQ